MDDSNLMFLKRVNSHKQILNSNFINICIERNRRGIEHERENKYEELQKSLIEF